jgi:hypothetical protein
VGEPIAFLKDGHVFFVSGVYLGRLEENEVWFGTYEGEVVLGDRLLMKSKRPSVTRSHGGTPPTPLVPQPRPKGDVVDLPAGYEDVEIRHPWVELNYR